ncbi:MAG: hypothetical protein DWG76_03575 [Chloroflexi bacterium]|nr:hypothetical protein [Chloroflexota bacterium]MQC26514.1 hypothetical protein [Chloroflexota bacterium]
MSRTKRLIQAYRQAPWRKQVQLVGFIVAGVAIVALIAGIYLDVTARAATMGRAVQSLQGAREDLEQNLEDLETELAYLNSVATMHARAEKLGFQELSSSLVTYLPVSGYEGRADAQLAPNLASQFSTGSRLPTAYTQSLFDWFGGLFKSLGGF